MADDGSGTIAVKTGPRLFPIATGDFFQNSKRGERSTVVTIRFQFDWELTDESFPFYTASAYRTATVSRINRGKQSYRYVEPVCLSFVVVFC